MKREVSLFAKFLSCVKANVSGELSASQTGSKLQESYGSFVLEEFIEYTPI